MYICPGWLYLHAGVKLTSTQEQERALGRIREQVNNQIISSRPSSKLLRLLIALCQPGPQAIISMMTMFSM